MWYDWNNLIPGSRVRGQTYSGSGNERLMAGAFARKDSLFLHVAKPADVNLKVKNV